MTRHIFLIKVQIVEPKVHYMTFWSELKQYKQDLLKYQRTSNPKNKLSMIQPKIPKFQRKGTNWVFFTQLVQRRDLTIFSALLLTKLELAAQDFDSK